MPLFSKKIFPYVKKIVSSLDLKELLIDYFVEYLESYFARVYQGQGIFEGADSIGSTSPDTFSIYDSAPGATGGAKGIDGNGKEVDLEDDTYGENHMMATIDFPFENTLSQVYQLGMRPQETPKMDDNEFPALEVNPNTGEAQYSAYEDTTGELGEPDNVSYDSLTDEITFEVDAVVGDSLSWVDRWAIAYLNNPVSVNRTIAFMWAKITYSGGKNLLVISGDLGQTAAGQTVSTLTTDYKIFIPGITVHKAALSTTVYCFLGTVTGAGSGNTPTIFSVSGQRRLDLAFGDNTANILTLGKDVYGDPLYASALIGTGAAYFNSPIKDWFETEHRAHDSSPSGERLTHSDINPDSIAVKQKSGAEKLTFRALDATDALNSKLSALHHSTGSPIGGILGDGSLYSNEKLILGDRSLPGTNPQAVPLGTNHTVFGISDDNLSNLPMSASTDAKNDLSELPESGLVGSTAGNYRRRITITVGDGTTTFGDYNGSASIKTAIESFAGSEYAGHVHIKYGDYIISNGPIDVPSNVMITGEGKGTRLRHNTTGALFKIDGEVFGVDGQVPDALDLSKFYSASSTFVTDNVRVGDYLALFYKSDLTQTYKNFGAYRISSVADENTLHVGPGRLFDEIDISAKLVFAVVRHGISINNLYLYGESGSGHLIQANRSHGCQFTDIYARRRTNSSAIYIANSFNTQVNNINVQSKDYAVYVYSSCGTNINNVSATNCTGAVYLDTINFQDSTNVSNVNAVRCTYAINTNSTIGSNFKNISAIRCSNDSLYIYRASKCNFSNISINECGRRGITFDYCNDVNISDAYVNETQYGSSGYTGIYVEGGSENITLSNCNCMNSYHGFYVDSTCEKITFSNCVARDNQYDGYHIDAPFCSFNNCNSFDNGNDGLDIASTGDNASITGGIFEGNGARGLEIAGTECVTVGSVIKNNTEHGVWSETNNLFTGCLIQGNGQDGIYGYHKITISGCNILYNNRDGVRIYGSESSIKSSMIAFNSFYGINFFSGDCSVVGNDLRNNSSGTHNYNGTFGNGLNAGTFANNVSTYNEI